MLKASRLYGREIAQRAARAARISPESQTVTSVAAAGRPAHAAAGCPPDAAAAGQCTGQRCGQRGGAGGGGPGQGTHGGRLQNAAGGQAAVYLPCLQACEGTAISEKWTHRRPPNPELLGRLHAAAGGR